MDFISTTEFLKNDMIRFLAVAPIVIPEEGTIVGFTKFDSEKINPPLLPRDMELYDNLHFSMGTTFLTYGFKGVAEQARKNIRKDMKPENIKSLEAIAETYDAICDFVLKHEDAVRKTAIVKEGARKEELLKIADDLHVIGTRKPETLRQAVQTFYFAWKLRSILNTATMGRLDQYFYPFYKADLEAGRITYDEAFALFCEYFRLANKSGSGDTLMNVMVGGQDKDGNDVSNDLSVMLLKVSAEVHMAEPHVNYRYHRNARKDLLEAAYMLQLDGAAHGTQYNDETIIPELIKNGIPREYACNYTNDGCTEIIIDQKSTIFFDRFDIVKCFEFAFYNGTAAVLPGEAKVEYWTRYMPKGEWTTILEEGHKSGDMAKATTFEEVYSMFKEQFTYQMKRSLRNLCDNYVKLGEEDVATPFLNGSYEECLKEGTDTHRHGLPVRCLTMFSGSIPTAADCLAALKDVVFDKKLYTLEEVRNAVKANFEGYEEMRRVLSRAPKFGNDIDMVDNIAAEIAGLFCDLCAEIGKEKNQTIWPAMLGYMFVQEAYMTGATPDGRKWKDPIAEHYSPTPGKAVNGPTAQMRSCGKAPLHRAFGTAVVHISLARSIVPKNEAGLSVVKALNEAAVDLGFVLFNVGVYDIEEMKDAKVHPERHEDIIVRVWGYSARFVDLSDEMQNHVMARIISNE